MTQIACSLDGPDYRQRMIDLSELARLALRSTVPIDGGLRHVFDDAAGVRERLEAAVAAEADCCSFLTMALRARDGALVLDVTGPADAQPVIGELFARDLPVPADV